MCVKAILEKPQNLLDKFLAFVDDDIIEYVVSEKKEIWCHGLGTKEEEGKNDEREQRYDVEGNWCCTFGNSFHNIDLQV